MAIGIQKCKILLLFLYFVIPGVKYFGPRCLLIHSCYSNIARKLWTNNTSDLLISWLLSTIITVFSHYFTFSQSVQFEPFTRRGPVWVNGCGPVAENLTPWPQNSQRSFKGVIVHLCVSSHQRLGDEWDDWGKQKLSVDTSKHGLYISASAQCRSTLSIHRRRGSKKTCPLSNRETRIWKECP